MEETEKWRYVLNGYSTFDFEEAIDLLMNDDECDSIEVVDAEMDICVDEVVKDGDIWYFASEVLL